MACKSTLYIKKHFMLSQTVSKYQMKLKEVKSTGISCDISGDSISTVCIINAMRIWSVHISEWIKNTFAMEFMLFSCFLDHRGVHQHSHWDGLHWGPDTGGDAGRILLCTRSSWMVNVFQDVTCIILLYMPVLNSKSCTSPLIYSHICSEGFCRVGVHDIN